MITKRVLALVLALMMTLTLFGCGEKPAEDGTDDAPKTVTITDMIGRQVEIVPGSYQRVVCIGAGALRLYSYVGDVSLLCGVEDIDNTTLEERPKMFDGVARPYVMVYGDTFAALPSCGVAAPTPRRRRRRRSCPVRRISLSPSMRTQIRPKPCSSRWVCRSSPCGPAWTACSARISAAPSPCWVRCSARRPALRSCCPLSAQRPRTFRPGRRVSPRTASRRCTSAGWATGAPPTT